MGVSRLILHTQTFQHIDLAKIREANKRQEEQLLYFFYHTCNHFINNAIQNYRKRNCYSYFFIISIIMLYTPCRSLNTFLQIMAQFDQILKNEERLS